MSRTRGREQVVFLMYTADGGGGVARTVINLANQLCATHDVEIVSVTDRKGGARFPVDPAVRVTYLQSLRRTEPRNLAPGDRRWRDRPGRTARSRRLAARPTSLLGDIKNVMPGMTAWGDRLIRRKIRSLRGGVLITTRPSLHVAAARWARPGVVTIAQDHLNFPTRSRTDWVMAAQREALEGLDAFVVLTAEDEADYRAWVPGARARVVTIPNASSWAVAGGPPDLSVPVAVTGGRFEHRKGFVRMVQAWAQVAGEFPQWQLHIYGSGAEQGRIEAAIESGGVADSVVLKGYSQDFDRVLRSGSVYLMASHYEGFPMVLVEAMGSGLPLVAYDCPRGPADVIEDGVNGRLVPDGDRDAYAEALREVLSDLGVRERMARAGLERARAYQPEVITQRWRELIEDLRG
ncbi:MAG: glycosyltransferase family 4 protein [Nocardioides sp.]|nr:glycosyltransferase family 4 protein [Nocardioides sp.]